LPVGRRRCWLIRWIDNLIRLQEKKRYHAYAFLGVVAFVAIARQLLETTLCRPIIARSIALLPNSVTFYLCIALMFTAGCAVLTRQPWQRCANVVMIGVFLGCFPPLIDTLRVGPYQCFYTYNTAWFASWPWWLYAPERNVDVGEAAALWSAIVLVGYYVYRRTQSARRALAAIAWGYATVALCGTIVPSAVRWLDQRYVLGSVGSGRATAIAPTLLATGEALVCLVCYLALNRRLGRRVLARLIHGAPFFGLTFVGAAHASWALRGAAIRPSFGPAAVVVPMLWLAFAVVASIVQNDYYDRDEDAPGAGCRHVDADDVRIATFLAALVALAALISAAPLGLILLLLDLTAVIYNAEFYRAKRYFPANYKIEAIWGAGAYLLGVLVITLGTRELPIQLWYGAVLAFAGWSAFSSIKDYKDIRADLRAGNQSLYVLVYRRGGSLRALHATLRIGLVACMAIPLALLGAAGLDPIAWALAAPWIGLVWWGLGRGPRRPAVVISFAAVTLYLVGLGVAMLRGA
jgi:hypothetical protein